MPLPFTVEDQFLQQDLDELDLRTVKALTALGLSGSTVAGAGGTVLPSSPVNGQEFYLQVPDGAMVQIWHCKYMTAVPGAYKWAIVGGGALAITAGGVGTVAAVGPTNTALGVTIPYAGDYDVAMDVLCTGAGAATGILGYRLGNGTVSIDNTQNTKATSAGASFAACLAFKQRVNAVPTGVLSMTIGATASLTFLSGHVVVTPVRIG